MESAVGQGTTQPFVKEQKQEGHLDALGGELVGVAAAIALQQTVALEFAQIVTKLVQSVSFGGKLKCGQNGLMDLPGSPAANGIASMQQNQRSSGEP